MVLDWKKVFAENVFVVSVYRSGILISTKAIVQLQKNFKR